MSFPNNLRQQKQNLRRLMEVKRAEAAQAYGSEAAAAVRDRFLSSLRLPTKAIVASYFPCGTELNPHLLDMGLRALGFPVALPIVTEKNVPLTFRSYREGDELIPGALNIPEPRADVATVEPTILLIPLLAFDRRGYRLGYGGGYYDRTLKMLRAHKTILAVGVAFACQEIPEVPIGIHDAILDKIVTEKDVF